MPRETQTTVQCWQNGKQSQEPPILYWCISTNRNSVYQPPFLPLRLRRGQGNTRLPIVCSYATKNQLGMRVDWFITATDYLVKPRCAESSICSQKWQDSNQADNRRHNNKEGTNPTDCQRDCPTNHCQRKTIPIHQESPSQTSGTGHPTWRIKDYSTRVPSPPQGVFRESCCMPTARLPVEPRHWIETRCPCIYQRTNLPSYSVGKHEALEKHIKEQEAKGYI